MYDLLTLLFCIGAGTVGGVFFAFSSFVMHALSDLPPAQGIAAMQRINVVVINPLFLSAFAGTAVLGVVVLAGAFLPWVAPRSLWLAFAGVQHVVGSFFVTGMFNVPRNNRLARLGAESPEALAYWPTYVREWVRWNSVRTVASVGAAACSAVALYIGDQNKIMAISDRINESREASMPVILPLHFALLPVKEEVQEGSYRSDGRQLADLLPIRRHSRSQDIGRKLEFQSEYQDVRQTAACLKVNFGSDIDGGAESFNNRRNDAETDN